MNVKENFVYDIRRGRESSIQEARIVSGKESERLLFHPKAISRWKCGGWKGSMKFDPECSFHGY